MEWKCTMGSFTDSRMSLTPDGHPQVWLLYTPEPFMFGSDDDRSIHLWARRCEVFSTQQAAMDHLDNILGTKLTWRRYDPLFPELWIAKDNRGFRWLMTSAGILDLT